MRKYPVDVARVILYGFKGLSYSITEVEGEKIQAYYFSFEYSHKLKMCDVT